MAYLLPSPPQPGRAGDPSRRRAQAVATVLGNHIDIVLEDVYNPELVPMSITNEERFPIYKEIGHPAMSIGVRIGMYAPKGTPDEVVRTLEAAFLEACNDKKYQDLLASLSMENLPLDQAATLESIKNATAVTQRLIDEGIMTVEE